METKVIVSKQGSLQWRDILRGLVMAVLTPSLWIIQQSLDKGEFVFNWKQIAMAAVAGGLAYLVKNILEPNKVIAVPGSETTISELKNQVNKAT